MYVVIIVFISGFLVISLYVLSGFNWIYDIFCDGWGYRGNVEVGG